MRIVLDTNVLIAAFIARGSCQQLLEYCINHHQLVTSDFILDEVREKFIVKFKYSEDIVDDALNLLRLQTAIVSPAPLHRPVCRDSDDDNVLATGLAGNCDSIITGDKDLPC